MAEPAVVVLVEGDSDVFAIEAAAEVCGVDLADVNIVAMGGATNVRRFANLYAHARIVGLCDFGERKLFGRHLDTYFVCERDLESEFIRALGADRVERIIESEGELQSLRKLQQMPFHRNRAATDHIHRFIGSRAGRKHRYATLLARATAADEMPRPLRELLDYVRSVPRVSSPPVGTSTSKSRKPSTQERQ